MKKAILGTAVAAVLGVASVGANAAAISSLTINSFAFAMNHTNSYEGGSDDNAANSINMPITMGQYDGGFGGATTADKTTGVVGFDFGFFGPVAAYTTGSAGGEPSGDVTGSAVTLDLNSWTAYWNGTEFNQGGDTSGTMTISNFVDNGNGTYDFDAVWTKLIAGGPPFGGQTGHWGMSVTASTASAVPVPAAAWLMGSALLGMIGVGRRKKATAV